MSKKVAPIKPGQVVTRKRIPDVVIETFNEMIAEKLSNGRCDIYQNEVVSALESKGLNREEIFKRNWLDVEDIFRRAGWKVEYDKPGYNESYKAFFTFKKK